MQSASLALFQVPARALATSLNASRAEVADVASTLFPYGDGLKKTPDSGCIPGHDVTTLFWWRHPAQKTNNHVRQWIKMTSHHIMIKIKGMETSPRFALKKKTTKIYGLDTQELYCLFLFFYPNISCTIFKHQYVTICNYSCLLNFSAPKVNVFFDIMLY